MARQLVKQNIETPDTKATEQIITDNMSLAIPVPLAGSGGFLLFRYISGKDWQVVVNQIIDS